MFWKECRRGGSLNTSLAQAKERTFRMKVIHNELPTLSNLAKRNPEVYNNIKECPWCKEEEETMDHLFSCKSLKSDREEIWKEVSKKIKEKWIPKMSKGGKETIQIPKMLIDFSEDQGKAILHSSKKLIDFSLGLINTEEIEKWIREYNSIKFSAKQTQEIVEKATRLTFKLIRKRIWNPRCEKIQQIERENGINRRDKRLARRVTMENQKTRKRNRRAQSRSEKRHSNSRKKGIESSKSTESENNVKSENSTEQSRSSELEDNQSEHSQIDGREPERRDLEKRESSRIEKVKEIVWDWIKEKKKWLGM